MYHSDKLPSFKINLDTVLHEGISRIKVTLVTASSAGLGVAIAKAFISDIGVVVNFSFNTERAVTLPEELSILALEPHGKSGEDTSLFEFKDANSMPRALAVRANLRDQTEIERLVTRADTKTGRLNVVISNGGWTQIWDLLNLDNNLDEMH
ncbi:hypothetical protein BGW36DRAFT_431840 [Talaromyces proteolyticus]|uniref:Uncharacterized protein n=1 Tax=Talaromyces proteolyticus TaxID=1131652 RepID=A0AAD4KFR0_9EURO|nr:uncharacterized protein BGW36DRAFT_431840 [Talaromyces proteolyticus]KAH8691288.1 hypothetical protein BGW36DRAFT_431840 [Talaromyces proteolyticus]